MQLVPVLVHIIILELFPNKLTSTVPVLFGDELDTNLACSCMIIRHLQVPTKDPCR